MIMSYFHGYLTHNLKWYIFEKYYLQDFDSVMIDGSHLSFKENIAYTKHIAALAHSKKLMVEAELGRLSGTEDDLTVQDYEAKLTDVNQVCPPLPVTSHPRADIYLKSAILLIQNCQNNKATVKFQAEEFIDTTGIDALAVCIGNVHGKYPASGPNLRLDLLKVKYYIPDATFIHNYRIKLA